jgi:hypothetical protein
MFRRQFIKGASQPQQEGRLWPPVEFQCMTTTRIRLVAEKSFTHTRSTFEFQKTMHNALLAK